MIAKNTKFWLLTMEFPPFYGGGISTYCKYWTDILCAKGVAVTVFLADPDTSLITIEQKENLRIIRFSPYLNNDAPPLGYNTLVSYAYAKIIGKYLEQEGVPDVLETQEYNGIGYYILQYKHLEYPLFKQLYIQVVCHAPSFLYLPFNKVPKYQLPYFWIGEMEKFCIKAADILIAPSQYIIDKIKDHIPLEGKEILILPNPYPTPLVTTVNIKQANLQTAIFYGKLSPSKGIFEILEFFSELWQQGLSIQLILAGDENYLYHPEMTTCGDIIKKKYKNEIAARKLIIKGSIAPEQLRQILNTAKFAVVPSLIDNFPYTLLECMALGKVVLASSQGGQAEIMEDGLNGFLFDHRHPETFLVQAKKIFSLDDLSLKKIGEAAISTITEICNGDTYYLQRSALTNVYKKNDNLFPYVTGQAKVKAVSASALSQKNLLSVVIPFYNLGKFIAETVESVYNTTYESVEIILINDGSTDKYSLEALKRLEQKYSSLKIISTQNQGLATARNTGAKVASGEFLAFLDADDKVHPEYYTKAIQILKEKENVHFAGCWTQYFGQSNDKWPTFNPEPPFLLIHNMVNSSGLVYEKKSFLTAGLNDASLIYGMEDYDSVISMVEYGFNGIVLPEILFYYRVRANSMARNFNRNKILYLYQLITEKHSKFYSTFAVEISNLLTVNGPGYKYDNPTLDHHRFASFSSNQKLIQKLIFKINTYPRLKKIGLRIFKYIKN